MTREQAIQLANRCRQAEIDSTVAEEWRAPVMRQCEPAEWVIDAILAASCGRISAMTERLPIQGRWYWVSTDAEFWFPALRDQGRAGGWTNQDCWEDFYGDVKHWIELPLPQELRISVAEEDRDG